MDNQLENVKFFLLYHYEQGITKKTLLAFLMELEEEKRNIITVEYKRDIDQLNPILIKQYLIKYLHKITEYYDKRKSKKV